MKKKEEFVKIRQGTKQGYILCKIGGVFSGEFPKSVVRRGRVIDHGNISPTILSNSHQILRIQKVDDKKQNKDTGKVESKQ